MIAVLLAASLAAPPSWTPNLADPRQRVLSALVEELTRSQESLRLHGHEAPYFLAYAIRGVTTQEVGAKYGAIFLDNSRRERRLSADDPERPSSFSRETPKVEVLEPAPHPFDREAWKSELRAQTERLRAHPELFDSHIRVAVDHEEREFSSTEGTRLVTEHVIYGMHVQAWTRAADGMLLDNSRDFYGMRESELPRGEDLSRKVDAMVEELLALRKAPPLDPYTGPAILAPEAAGVLFHEAVGHRLEGERQNDDKDGRTFKGQIGKAILPSFLSIVDDPTLGSWSGMSLNGEYR